jgi:hypothetical protein
VLYLITWNAAAIIKVHADVHAACPDGSQRAAAVGPPRASRGRALGPPSTLSHQFPPATLPPLLPPPPTALRAGQHLPDVGLEVFPFRCPVPVNDLLVIVVIVVVVIVVIVVIVVVIIVIVIVIVVVVVLARLCPIVVPLLPINRAVIPLFILYQPSSLLLGPS